MLELLVFQMIEQYKECIPLSGSMRTNDTILRGQETTGEPLARQASVNDFTKNGIGSIQDVACFEGYRSVRRYRNEANRSTEKYVEVYSCAK